MVRTTVRFGPSEQQCEAWLYVDGRHQRPQPGIVLAHGVGGVRQMRLDAYAERFAAAGYACLVFDYRHFGGSDGHPRQLLDIARQRQDWRAAIAYARSRPEIDPDRIVAWGTSFGGGHVLTVAASDDRLAAVIAQCPFTSGPASTLAKGLRSAALVTRAAVSDQLRHLVGGHPRMVASAGPPGSGALMDSPDAETGYLRLAEGISPSLFRNEVTARIGLTLPFDSPARRVHSIQCPVFFAVCQNDTVAPAKPTLRAAHRARRGHVREYPAGHFEIYQPPWFDQVSTHMIQFLEEVVT